MPEEESIFRKIKTRLLPPSSRSFHSCMGELRDANRVMREQNETLIAMLERTEGRNAELTRRLDGQSTELADLRARLDRIDGGIGDISRKCDIKARHDEVRFEAAARMLAGNGVGRDAARDEETHIRIPLAGGRRPAPHAAGECEDHGKARRDMPRERPRLLVRIRDARRGACTERIHPMGRRYRHLHDERRHQKAGRGVREDRRRAAHPRIRLGPLCRQVRFSSTDDGIPCFIDVSIYDWAKDASEETDGRLREIRLSLMDELRHMSESGEIPYWNEHPWLFARGSGFVPQVEDVDIADQDDDKTEEAQKKIQSVFDRYNSIAADEGLICEKEQATAIAYAADNIYDAPWRRITWEIGDFLPPQRHAYDGYEFCVPNMADEVATECYPG